MTKYYLKDTGESIKFGDTIRVNKTSNKDGAGEIINVHCTFTPDLVPILATCGIIDIKEEAEKPKKETKNEKKVTKKSSILDDVDDKDELLEILAQDYDVVVDRLIDSENTVKKMEKEIDDLMERLVPLCEKLEETLKADNGR